MPEKPLRIVLVGAGALLGKALNEELSVSAFAAADLHLVDDEAALGKLTAAGDEATFIQQIEPDSFDGCDFTFFAGSRELTRTHWHQAFRAGSRIVDLSGELEGEPGVPLRAPWVQDNPAAAPDLQTRAVVSAHPVALLLALLVTHGGQTAMMKALWATLLQPASEYGHEALEELHRQTANLLSFQPLPTDVFRGQSAFTLAVSFGGESPVQPAGSAGVISGQYAEVAPAGSPSLALQVIQAPVFHGYALSVAVELSRPLAANALGRALAGPHVHIVADADAFPGNVRAVEEEDMQVLVRPVFEDAGSAASRETRRFWLWIVADNLKLAAQNAIACAAELDRLRPRGGVQ